MNEAHVVVGSDPSLLIMSFFFAVTGKAAEQTLIDITHDESNEVMKFIIETDDKSDARTFYKKTYTPKGELVKTQKMEADELFSKDGLILEKRNDYIVATLRSKNFANHTGGHIKIDTLYNGATNDREDYEIEIDRIGDQWEIQKQDKTVKKMHLKSKKLPFLGTVGIEKIIFK